MTPELLPFVRLFYGQPSTYCWWDAEGCCRDIQQGQGCEQGDALAPALFSIGQHGGLERASSQLQHGERLLAFLDDLYILTPTPARARPARDMVVAAVEAHCGIASNEGKTRVFAIGRIDGPPGPSPQPPGIAPLAVGTASQCLADSRAERPSLDATARHHANCAAPAGSPPVAFGPTTLWGGWPTWLWPTHG